MTLRVKRVSDVVTAPLFTLVCPRRKEMNRGRLSASVTPRATTTRNSKASIPKATLALNVSCHLIHAPLIHGQTRPLDSMHACLNVDEIVRLIARELVASGGRGTAVALACCCKDFEDPALDALWVEQYRLFPLLDSLPADVWNEGRCTVSVLATSVFPFPQRFGSKVFQKTPDDD